MYKFLAKILVLIFFLYNCFALGIANLQIFSIPILQFLSLVISIIFLVKMNKEIASLFSQSFWFFLLIFILYVLAIFIKSLSNGYPIIRVIQDAEIFYDIIFIFAGISVANYMQRNDLIKMFTYLFIFMAIWFFTIIIIGQDFIKLISPQINGIYRPVPLFGSFPSHVILLLSIPFFLFVRKNIVRNKILAFLIGVVTLLAQKRFILIELLIMGVFYYKNLANRIFINFLFIIPLIFISLLTLEALEIRTSKGNIFSLDLMSGVWQSTFVENEDSGGVNWRFNLFSDALDKINGVNDIIFGTGFGHSLTNLTDNSTGQIIRTPHVYFLTVFLRTGLIGLGFTLYFFCSFLIRGYENYVVAKDNETKNLNYFLFMSFVIFLIEAQTNPMLEYAHVAYPRYFILGLLLGQKS